MNTPKPEFVRAFAGLTKNDAHLAGGKGASLGEMSQAGIPVPPGFVVLSESFEYFIHETDLVQEIDAILSKVNHKEIHTVEKASESIKELILSREMPADIAAEILAHFKKLGTEYVAVRSSATAEDGKEHAWAGQLESYLNVKEAGVLEKVRHCWASLFTPRAIFYRFEKGLHSTKISVAVVVQKMVNSERSGIAFSVHPVTEDYNQLIIEAGFGLGEAIVSGSVTPDSYVVGKEPRTILDVNVSTQERALYRVAAGGNEWRTVAEPQASSQVLTAEEILTLSEIIMRIEKHYGFPCDIEWAYEAGQFYIVQSRPITTLSNSRQEEKSKKYEKTYTRECSLVTMEIWEGQYDTLKEKLETSRDVPFTIYDTYDGVVDVYFDKEVFNVWYKLVADKAESNIKWTTSVMEWYANNLNQLEKIWRVGRVASATELESFYKLATASWAGLGISYVLPEMKTVRQEDRDLAMSLRERSQNFLEDTDHVAQNTLKNLFPELGELIKFISLEEVRGNTIPSKADLKERQRHYIYYGFRTIVKTDFSEFLKNEHIQIQSEIIPNNVSELKGQVAMKGYAKGRVRILRKKSEIPALQGGEILVTAMTTPDYLPAMQKAVAFVTDEGGITCHAAIVSRELNKPCIIGTKFATQIFKDGDMVEVDAEKGVVRKIL